MPINKYVIFLLVIMLSACQAMKNNSYQQPVSEEVGNFFMYTPDTQQKNSDAVLIYIDDLKAGEISENRPLQLSATTGWHKVAVRRQSALGAREELAKFDMLVEKDIIYYVRYAKTTDATVSVLVGSSTFGVVDENTGRQMQ
jgi:hypothetical protein